MTARQFILIVAGREIRDRLRNRTFQVTTGLLLVIGLAAVILPGVFGGDGEASWTVGATQEGAAAIELAPALAPGFRGELTIESFDDEVAAIESLREGEIDLWVRDGQTVLSDGLADNALTALLDLARRSRAVQLGLADLGVTSDQATAILSTPGFAVQNVALDADVDIADQILASAVTVLLFMLVQINGGMLLTGTIEEKSTRVAEVLLGTLRPWHLLAGKLVGYTTLAMGQFALLITAVLSANAVVDTIELPSRFGATAAAGLLMFGIGFLFYASVFIMAGAMASSVEEAQASAGPIILLTVLSYVLVLTFVVPDPNGLLAVITTFVPASAPFAVPTRMAVGAASWPEVGLSALVTAAATVAMIRFAGRLYGAALLAGGKLSWRQLRKAEPIEA